MNIARQILRALLFILPLYGFVLGIYCIPHYMKTSTPILCGSFGFYIYSCEVINDFLIY